MKKIINYTIILLALVLGIFLVWKYYLPSSAFLGNQKVNKENTISSAKDTDKQTRKIKIVAVGDSLTAGYGLEIYDSYPAQLERKLQMAGKDVEIINMGVSGETTAGLLERVEFIKKQKPDFILITIGGNDALRALPVESTKNNITEIIQSFKEDVPSDRIFIARIQAPANLGLGYTQEFNRIYNEISDSENIVLLEFVVPEVFTNSELMQGDGIHPNREGYEKIIDEYIFEVVNDELDNF